MFWVGLRFPRSIILCSLWYLSVWHCCVPLRSPSRHLITLPPPVCLSHQRKSSCSGKYREKARWAIRAKNCPYNEQKNVATNSQWRLHPICKKTLGLSKGLLHISSPPWQHRSKNKIRTYSESIQYQPGGLILKQSMHRLLSLKEFSSASWQCDGTVNKLWACAMWHPCLS